MVVVVAGTLVVVVAAGTVVVGVVVGAVVPAPPPGTVGGTVVVDVLAGSSVVVDVVDVDGGPGGDGVQAISPTPATIAAMVVNRALEDVVTSPISVRSREFSLEMT